MEFDLGLQRLLDENNYQLVFSKKTLEFGESSEPEIKDEAVYGTMTFSDALRIMPVLEFGVDKKTGQVRPKTDVFMMEPVFHFKDNILASFGLDTIDNWNEPTCEVFDTGHQLRERMALRPYLGAGNKLSMGAHEASLKNLYSRKKSSLRTEIQAVVNKEGTGVDDLMIAKHDQIPAEIHERKIRASRLGVYVPFLTTRGSWFMGVYLAHRAMIVVFEVSNDATDVYTPALDKKAGPRRFEKEPEGKGVILTKMHHFPLYKAEQSAEECFTEAEPIYKAFMAHHMPGHFRPQGQSKIERGNEMVGDFYRAHWNREYLTEAGRLLARVPGVNEAEVRAKDAMMFALVQGISMHHVVHGMRARLLELATEALSPRGLIDVFSVNTTRRQKGWKPIEMRAFISPDIIAAAAEAEAEAQAEAEAFAARRQLSRPSSRRLPASRRPIVG